MVSIANDDRIKRNENKDVYMRVYDEYRVKVYDYAYLLTQCTYHAEDLVQDVFARIWIEKEKLSEIGNLKAYLYTITRNKVIDQLRRSQKEQLIISELMFRKEGLTVKAEDVLDGQEFNRIMAEAVKQLPRQRMLVYSLGKLHGWKRDEISCALGISPATVRVHMNQALRFVKKYINSRTGIN